MIKWFFCLTFILTQFSCKQNSKVIEVDISSKNCKNLYFVYFNNENKLRVTKSIELTLNGDNGKVYMDKNIPFLVLSTSIKKVIIEKSGNILAIDSNIDSQPNVIGFLNIFKIDNENIRLFGKNNNNEKGIKEISSFGLSEKSRMLCIKEVEFEVIYMNEKFHLLKGNSIIINLN